MGTRNKIAGNSYELSILHELEEELGIENIVTARAESRNLDNSGVDLMIPGFPELAVQCKTAINQPNFIKLLRDTACNIVMFKKTKKAKVNFVEEYQMVGVDKEFFYKLLKLYVSTNKNI